MQRLPGHSIPLHKVKQQEWPESIETENIWSQHIGRSWVKPDCSQLTWKENIQAPILVPLMLYWLKGIYIHDTFPVISLLTFYFPSFKEENMKKVAFFIPYT